LLALESVPMPTTPVSLCLLCRHEAGEGGIRLSYPFPAHMLFDSFTRRSSPGANRHWHTFAGVGQELRYSCQRRRCTLWYNCSSSLDGSRLAVGAPMHDYSTAEERISVNDNGGAIFLYEYDGSAWNQIGSCRRHWRRSWRTPADGSSDRRPP
jgi:hypothetical protein